MTLKKQITDVLFDLVDDISVRLTDAEDALGPHISDKDQDRLDDLRDAVDALVEYIDDISPPGAESE